MGIDWEGIPMSQRELHRYHTLRLVREGRITGAQAAAAAQGIEGNYVPCTEVALQRAEQPLSRYVKDAAISDPNRLDVSLEASGLVAAATTLAGSAGSTWRS